ncbi:MAG: Bax inhibitor-1/YccA family protein [Candidatus Babeliaceae bacterium]
MVTVYESTGLKVYSLMYRVFTWMGVALALTGVTAYYVSLYPALQKTFLTSGWFLGLVLLQFALVIILSFFILKINFLTALLLFILYALLNGLLLSVIFTVYTTASIATTFFIASVMFISMAVYGFVTKADLTSMGSFLMMALWGLIIALLVNLFLRSAMVDFITAFIGVIIFSGLTAFDIQKIKQLSAQLLMESEMAEKIAVIGALQLYLDFINIFLSLLRLTGRSRE